MIMSLGIAAVTMKSKICNGSPSLQSALWQSESRSVKERERILHRLHCAKAGLSVWCPWPSLRPCSAVQCSAPVPASAAPMDSGPPQAPSPTSPAGSGVAPMESVEAVSLPVPVSVSDDPEASEVEAVDSGLAGGSVVFSGGMPVAVAVGEPVAERPQPSDQIILDCTVALDRFLVVLNRLNIDLLASRNHPAQALVILLLNC